MFFKDSTAQSWQWSKQAGGLNNDFVQKMCIDINNNIYIAGEFSSTNFICESDTLHCNGNNDFFISKYDLHGNLQWIKGFGGLNPAMTNEGINTINYDASTNSILVAGLFYGTCAFDNDTIVSVGNSDAFIAKFDLNGNCLWAKRAGGTGQDAATAMAVDQNGGIILSFLIKISGTIDTFSVQPGSILAKYDTAGICLWTKVTFHTNTNIIGYDGYIKALKIYNGNVFALGASTVNSYSIDTISVVTNIQNGQYFIARFNSSGTACWVKPCAGQDSYGGWEIVVDTSLNSYITGSFSQIAIFDNDTLTTNNNDMFIAEYDSTGLLIWVQQSNCSSNAGGQSLALSENGVYLTGGFVGDVTFGSYALSSGSNGALFIANYNSSGSCLGINQVMNAWGSAIEVDKNDVSIYVAGGYLDSATFGSNAPLVGLGMSDIFIAKSDAITGENSSSRIVNNNLIIYANPNKGTCNVIIPDEFINEKNLVLSIFDNSGKLIQHTNVAMVEGKIKLNIEAQATGVYNVTLCNKRKCYNGKIVFE